MKDTCPRDAEMILDDAKHAGDRGKGARRTGLLGLSTGESERTLDREAIAAFADAIGDPDPVYRDPEAARALGYPDAVAPPTAAAMLFIEPLMELVRKGGIDFAHLVHGDQSYEFLRPVVAGEPLRVSGTIVQEYARAGHLFVTVESRAKDGNGDDVVRGRATLVVRGGGAP